MKLKRHTGGVYLIILLSCLPSIEESPYTLFCSPWSRPSMLSSRLKSPSWESLKKTLPINVMKGNKNGGGHVIDRPKKKEDAI